MSDAPKTGPHKGVAWRDIPESYLLWAKRTAHPHGGRATEELLRRYAHEGTRGWVQTNYNTWMRIADGCRQHLFFQTGPPASVRADLYGERKFIARFEDIILAEDPVGQGMLDLAFRRLLPEVEASYPVRESNITRVPTGSRERWRNEAKLYAAQRVRRPNTKEFVPPTPTTPTPTEDTTMGDKSVDKMMREHTKEELAKMLQEAQAAGAKPVEPTAPTGIFGHPTVQLMTTSGKDAVLLTGPALAAQTAVHALGKKVLAYFLGEEYKGFLETPAGKQITRLLSPLIVHALATHLKIPAQEMVLKLSDAAFRARVTVATAYFVDEMGELLVMLMPEFKDLGEMAKNLLTDTPDFEGATEVETERERELHAVGRGE